MFTKEALRDFFREVRRLRDRGELPFDIDGDCRWSFFFLAEGQKPLERLGAVLAEAGFEVWGLVDAPEGARPGARYLRVDEVKAHSVASLDGRNRELARLAKSKGATYDGMDVGPVEGP